MSTSSGKPGHVNLTDDQVRLNYVNRALGILRLNCGKDGVYTGSSSERLLSQRFPELNQGQVVEINTILHNLGLRESPCAGTHYIRTDITRVTMEQLRRGKKIPLGIPDEPAELPEPSYDAVDLLEVVSTALWVFRNRGESIKGDKADVSIVRQHKTMLVDIAGQNADKVLNILERLGLCRVYEVGNERLCFVCSDEAIELTAESIDNDEPLVSDWPETVEGLLPVNSLVTEMTPEQMVLALTEACERLRALLQQERASNDELNARISELESALTALKLSSEGDRAELERQVEELEARLTEARGKTVVISSGLQRRVADILNEI